ncbi:MAG: alpha-ketoacid dehydrogenase subunit beta [Calditrichaeota bacterium]|nr:alpha-ketoacid dehydrogenase subunit beta [Calditrichota bacterium]
MAETTYLEAIKQGLREELLRDERVFLLGEDIGVYGGAFKVTKGLVEEFGEERIIDTPLSESAIIGAAMGAAVMGMRPVAEIQFSDFSTNAFTQIVNNVAKAHYRYGAVVPLTIRCPSGGNVHGGPYHSQNPEAWFTQVPGLKVVAPSTAYDAKGLIKAAIRDNNPVIFFEHKYLYRRIKETLPNEDFIVPIGKAKVQREGQDMSIITYGAMVHYSLEAAQILEKEGISVEVVDLRSLLPFDKDRILESVKKTSRVLVAYEAPLTGGFGGEIAAVIADEGFEFLDAPVRRIASLDTPVPFSPPLEEFYMPNPEKIAEAARNLMAY